MQIGLVDRLVEAGTTQEVIRREVLDIEEDDDQWFVYTDETINIILRVATKNHETTTGNTQLFKTAMTSN